MYLLINTSLHERWRKLLEKRGDNSNSYTVLAIYLYAKYNKIQVNDSNIYHKENNKHPFQ